MIELYQRVALRHDLPEHRLKQGDVAMLIDYITHPTGSEDGYVLEIFNAVGESIAVVAVAQSAIEPLPTNAVLAVRSLVETK